MSKLQRFVSAYSCRTESHIVCLHFVWLPCCIAFYTAACFYKFNNNDATNLHYLQLFSLSPQKFI